MGASIAARFVWINVKFDSNQHLYLGYCKSNVGLEAAAYKIQNEISGWFFTLAQSSKFLLLMQMIYLMKSKVSYWKNG
ncbi:DUF3986 family protein [Parageobacillus thermantarcticus]|uniref:DUF3986 family protein n=1 Tax=Parageobacillus thermantarcticus TaxID=186116 RepID=UPI00313448DB